MALSAFVYILLFWYSLLGYLAIWLYGYLGIWRSGGGLWLPLGNFVMKFGCQL